MPALNHSLRAFHHYISGGTSKALKKRMAYYNHRPDELEHDFYTMSVCSMPVRAEIEIALGHLHIPPSQWFRYFRPGKTVSDVLTKLTRENHLQAAYFLDIIETKKSTNRVNKLMAGLLVVAVAAGILSTPALSGVLNLVEAFLAWSKGMPILGMISTGIMTLLSFYHTYYDKRISRFNRFRDLFFLLAKTVLSYVSYGYWLATGPIMPLLGAWLFVAASMIDTVKEVFCLVQEYVKYKYLPPNYDSDIKNAYRQAAYHDMSFQKHRNAALINLVIAVVLLGIIAAWSFVPMGLVLNLVIIASIAVVFAIKHYALTKNDQMMKERLQSRLKEIEESPSLSNLENHRDQDVEDDLSSSFDVAPRYRANPDAKRHKGLMFFSQADSPDTQRIILPTDEPIPHPHRISPSPFLHYD